jgi:glycosyltransferase involved in cell wall biosynthesis
MSAIEHITKLFESKELMELMSNKSKLSASKFTWHSTAKQFEKEILNL